MAFARLTECVLRDVVRRGIKSRRRADIAGNSVHKTLKSYLIQVERVVGNCEEARTVPTR